MIGGALYSWGGYCLPFAVLGFTLLCTALLCYVTLPKSADDEDVRPTGPSMMNLLRVPGVLLAAITIISTSMSIGFLQATLEPHLRQFNFSPVILGVIFIINGGIYALSAPGWGWLCDHHSVKAKVVTVIGHVFVVAAFLLVGPAPFFDMPTTLWVTILGLVLHGFGMGSLLVSSFSDALGTAISSGLPNSIETYGLVSGMWTSTFALGAFFGPSIAGLLFDSIGFRCATLFISVLHVITMLLVIIYICICDRPRMEVSVSAGDLLQIDGTLDESVLIGEKYLPTTRPKSRRFGITVEQSRPPAMNSLIACSSFKNRRSPWSQRTPRYRPSYGSLDTRFRGTVSIT
ncbi:MFS-type transporter SLC18B1-like isoform X2 [Leptidea sinapis]|nr:MFS-type transporter SLC18B1-like isoform X2 [Leptidea sinapis]